MRETTEFVITNRWNDRNVTRMLLKCEQEHDLDALLMETDNTKSSLEMRQIWAIYVLGISFLFFGILFLL